MYTMQRWKNRVALITGASSGIGWEAAKTLAGEGMRVAICARRQNRLEKLAGEMKTESAMILPIPTDVRVPQEVSRAFEKIRSVWGGVDVLINSAGVGYKSPICDGDLARWQEMLEVNILGLCHCTYEAIQDLRDRGDDGHIILISSIGAYRHKPGSIGNGVYVASKRAVRSLTESIRMELRSLNSKIRVTAISPGLVETEFTPRFLQDYKAGQSVYQKTQTLQPQDIAEMIRFILACPPHVQIHDLIVRPTEQES